MKGAFYGGPFSWPIRTGFFVIIYFCMLVTPKLLFASWTCWKKLGIAVAIAMQWRYAMPLGGHHGTKNSCSEVWHISSPESLQVMDQALEKGLIFIDGSGPTYATATVSAMPKLSVCTKSFYSRNFVF